jgi:hypothetical protein
VNQHAANHTLFALEAYVVVVVLATKKTNSIQNKSSMARHIQYPPTANKGVNHVFRNGDDQREGEKPINVSVFTEYEFESEIS